ncbi:hypothetical protein K504DRAFT_45205 [Pleomassaria siparia CBS 279.74]|uniref:F-box domain-containing protein n=1 Tax=Pleomassaria siparia CBS 279.74 TaxID=1314801 RepID=A0A6G1K4M4_9PLEO|nr:hypothetical protein K504DRAFT_45205 [Pleomassaria siparia CBS 279.74]
METLPDELLLHIFERVPTTHIEYFESPKYDGTDHLHQVCLVSQRFNRVATPLLYAVIDEHGWNPLVWSSLLDTLSRRPDLRKHVKTIRINEGISENNVFNVDDTVFTTLHDRIVPLAQELELPMQEEMLHRLRNGEDVVIGPLIYLAHNLEQLFIRGLKNPLMKLQEPLWIQPLNHVA